MKPLSPTSLNVRDRQIRASLRALDLPEPERMAGRVTGGPDHVGVHILTFNMVTGRIEFAAPGALKTPGQPVAQKLLGEVIRIK